MRRGSLQPLEALLPRQRYFAPSTVEITDMTDYGARVGTTNMCSVAGSSSMIPDRDAWAGYDRWNDLLAAELFPETEQPSPVYLDLEADVLSRVAARIGVPEDGVVQALAGAVASTVEVESARAFRHHRQRLSVWRTGDRERVNPLIALLAVFSLAAERMASGEGMSANNYYGRLATLLGGKAETLGKAYRAIAEPFWGSLNLWLTTVGGARGLPTAYSVGMRFVGLAVSQALVREADRRRLERFFSDFDLAPRSELPPAELTPLLGSWIGQDPSPATKHLVALWSRSGLQDRVAEVAATLLSEWDGIDSETEGLGPRGRASLAMSITAFPRKQVRLRPVFFLPRPEQSRSVVLHGERDESVVLVQSSAAAMSFQDPGIIDAASLLEGVLEVEDDLAGTIRRRPRGLVVFRKDDLTGDWVEVQQVLMGDDVVVLVADRLRQRVEGILAEVSRPGWEPRELPGVPEGWTLLQRVEIFSRPSDAEQAHSDVRALVPLTSSQLKLAGGLALPGPLRNRWHSARPPELRAVSDVGESFSVRLLDLGAPGDDRDDEVELGRWDDGGSGSVIRDLAGLELEDGDYAVELCTGETALSRKQFSLRSSSTPEASLWERAETIEHAMSAPLSLLGAGDPSAGGPVVQGVVIDADPTSPEASTAQPPRKPWWISGRDRERATKVVLRRPSQDSCFYSGMHRFELETAMYDSKGRPLSTTTMGVCEGCGLQKRYSSSYWRNKKKFERQQARAATVRVDVAALPPSEDRGGDLDEDWEVALDALRYAGGGPIAVLERVARQLDPSRVFVKEFTSTLEALGHIEVRRSPETLAPVAWEVCPTTVVDTGSERVLTGFWSSPLVDDATESVENNGSRLVSTRQVKGPDRWATTATDDELLEWLDVDGVLVAGRAGPELARLLPALSTVVGALPRARAAGHLDVQWFDPARSSWVDGVGIDGVGAYRVGRYASQYLLRTEADVANGTVALADVYLVKHAASVALCGKPLLAYQEETGDLAVPLGASLPGMYQRAAVLDSGRSPERRRGYLVYPGVSRNVAHRLTYLLEN